MDKIESKLKEMGYELPPPFVYPKYNRIGCTQSGNILFMSGHGLSLPQLPGVRQRGKLGVDVSQEEGYATARAVMLTMLASIKQHCGSLDKVRRVLRLMGMVNCPGDYEGMAAVIDGASDLVYELWGPEFGVHARTAVGMTLPRGIAVEINGEFELHP